MLSLMALLLAVLAPAASANHSGTVKVSGDQSQNHPDNEPHVPCQFNLEFFQFEAETVEVEFTAQQPSGTATILTDTVTLEPEGEGEPTFNGTAAYDFTGMLDGFERHEQQGYHVKVTVDDDTSNPPAKHKVFWVDCPEPEPEPEPEPAAADLLVDKVVTGDGAPAAGTQFEFTVTCDEVVVSDVLLADGDDPWSWNDDAGEHALDEDSECSLVEDDDQDASSVTVAFNDGASAQGAVEALDAGDNTFVVTNDFTSEGDVAAAADLRVDKVVSGDDAPAAGTQFEFTVTCDEVVVSDVLLADGDAPWSWNDDAGEHALDEDSECSLVEDVDQDASSVTVTFNDGASAQGAVEALDAGDNTFVVTNDFTSEGGVAGEDEVADNNDVTPEDDAAAEEDVTPEADVAGVAIVKVPAPSPAEDVAAAGPDAETAVEAAAQELPATGISSTGLLLIALSMIGFGGVAVTQGGRRARAG